MNKRWWTGWTLCWAGIAWAAAVPEGETHRIDDGGAERIFEIALDEIALPSADGYREVRSVAGVPSASDLRRRAVRLGQETGREVELVLYEVGAERNPTTRRLLTRKVRIQAEPGADLAALAAAAGSPVPQAVPHAPGWFLVEADGIDGALDLAERWRKVPGVRAADALLARRQQKKWVPNDTLFSQQWHLVNTGQGGGTAGIDVNVTNVWDAYRGTNLLIGIVDDGLQLTHTDLWQSVNTAIDWDWNGDDADPSPNVANEDFHGTACAGVAAGKGNNGRGVSGAAPEATLVGYRLIGGEADDAMEASAMATNNHLVFLKSNSWGPYDDGRRKEAPGTLTQAAISNAATTGRGGRGTILVWAGGNGYQEYDDSNYDGYANSIYTIAVAAIADDGVRSWYSETGANLVVAAPSSGGATDVVTTDLMGNDGYNYAGASGELADANYTQTFGGTSSAAPLVAGILALVLEANPDLGWRDVQEILIRTATKNDAANADWRTNSAGFAFNHSYGSGLINAREAVALAQTWSNLGPQERVTVVQTNLNRAIPDADAAGITQLFAVASSDLRVEHVTVTLSATHTYRGDLAITLTSPSGMQSRLSEQHNDSNDGYTAWTFSSVRHWGEPAEGTWTLKVADLGAADTGTLLWARVEFIGSPFPEETRSITNWVGPAGVAGMSVQIPTTAGVTNVLQYTTNLASVSPAWVSVATTNGTGSLVTLQDPDAASPKRYYRIVKP